MKCTVQRITKNLRYRLLTIGEEKYILDMGGVNLWKMLLPIFYWLLPNRVYKMNEIIVTEELEAPPAKKKGNSSIYGWIAAASIILGNILSPFASYFDIASPRYINISIVTVIIFLEFLLILILNKILKNNMYHMVDLKKLPKRRLWIRPVSFKSFFLFAWIYILFWGFSILFFAAYIEHGNWTILIIATVTFLIALVMPGLLTVIEGKTRIKFFGIKN